MDAGGAIGTDNCKTVRDNVFENGNPGSFYEAILEPTTAENNYITGFGNGIWATTSAATIDHNIIQTGSGSSNHAVYSFTNSNLVAVTGNIIFGAGYVFDTGTSSSHFTENYCDGSQTHCYNCQIAGYCTGIPTPTAPFTFP
jgi:hypothetical protein